MGWKELPKWTKILVYVSLVIFICLSVTLIYALSLGGESGVFGLLFFITYMGTLIGMWILGFFNKWLVSKRIKWLPNVISVIGLVSMLVASLWSVYERIRYSGVLGWHFGGLNLGHVLGWQVPYWIVIIYFVVSLILINKKT